MLAWGIESGICGCDIDNGRGRIDCLRLCECECWICMFWCCILGGGEEGGGEGEGSIC